jgi:ATP adenylyltransferase
LDRLWSPWRAKYIASGVDAESTTCVFCRIAEDSTNDETNLVVHRGVHNFVALNLYPYITSHLLIVPYQHIGNLSSTAKEATDEMMDLAKRTQSAIQDVYAPHGFNLGMNLGAAAGAGIVDHIHLHILPRWSGDTNFMTTIADARVIPESLETTYSKLRSRF